MRNAKNKIKNKKNKKFAQCVEDSNVETTLDGIVNTNMLNGHCHSSFTSQLSSCKKKLIPLHIFFSGLLVFVCIFIHIQTKKKKKRTHRWVHWHHSWPRTIRKSSVQLQYSRENTTRFLFMISRSKRYVNIYVFPILSLSLSLYLSFSGLFGREAV